MIRKIVCLIIILSFLASLLACAQGGADGPANGKGSDTSEKTDDTVLQDNTTIYYEPDGLSDSLNFKGEKVFVLTALENDFTVEGLTSEPVNDSVYNREKYVEDRLGVEIEEKLTGSDYSNMIRLQVNSNEDTYSIYSYNGYILSNFIFDGYFMDLYEVDNLDLSKPWWSQKFNDEIEIEDSLYLATGSITLSLLRNLFAVYFNKKAAEDYSNAYPELSDLYGVVERGEWTFDRFIELGGDIYEDLNGSQTADADDFYGINYLKFFPLDAIWSGFDLDVLTKDDDGWFELNVNTDKLYTALDKLYNLMYNVKGCTAGAHFLGDYKEVGPMFASGQNLFMVGMLGLAEEPDIRNMTDDYGILPYPKFDSAQKEYYSYSYDEYRVFAIPITNSRSEIAGAVLEAMASYSYRNTVPTYLDLVLKGKYMSDASSRRTVDTLVEGFMLDAAWVYIDTLSEQYTPNFRYMIMDGESSWAADHQKKTTLIKFKLKAFREKYEKNNKK